VIASKAPVDEAANIRAREIAYRMAGDKTYILFYQAVENICVVDSVSKEFDWL
jgi:hypothetical protein